MEGEGLEIDSLKTWRAGVAYLVFVYSQGFAYPSLKFMKEPVWTQTRLHQPLHIS